MFLQGFFFSKRKRWWLVLPGSIVLAMGSIFIPWNTWNLKSSPNPVKNYAEALQRIADGQVQETALLNPLCQTQVLTHGQTTEQVIILVHGYTSCPEQFMQLGQLFYQRGWNVLLAPMPRHGYVDRMTKAHAELTAEELAVYSDEVVDIAQGLGKKVAMAGLSVGGLVTAFAATRRDDLDVAMLIAPAFSYNAIPTMATSAAMNAFAMLPNGYGWWNEDTKENGGVPHGYPRYAKRTLAQSLRLSYATRRQLPKSRKMIVVTNANDVAVNNELTYQTIAHWKKQGINLETHEFPLELNLDHDLIEPLHPNANTTAVYPKLVELMTQAVADKSPSGKSTSSDSSSVQ